MYMFLSVVRKHIVSFKREKRLEISVFLALRGLKENQNKINYQIILKEKKI